MRVVFGVLGPVVAWDDTGDPIALRGPRHRAVLARLIIARRRVVPVIRLVEDLWVEPPQGAVSAVRTFVAALRRALEPARPPRAPARLLVTEGPGYALRAEPDTVDAWRFERVVAAAAALPPQDALVRLEEALGWWRGPGYADFADADWATAERAKLAELRLHAVERQAEARLALGLAAAAVPDLDAHVAEHPWREDAWRLLALALYRAGRQGDALAVLRRARTLLVEQLGVDPGPALRRLEADILHQAEHLDPVPATAPGRAKPAPTAGPESPGSDVPSLDWSGPESAGAAAQVWVRAAAAYDRTVASGARARLESTVGLLRSLAVTGGDGLRQAREHRMATVTAAEETGDPELTARVIGAYDVPAIWTRSDDPEQAAQLVAAAERTLSALPPGGHEAARARLLATIALEARGTLPRSLPVGAADDDAPELKDGARGPEAWHIRTAPVARGLQAARQAVVIARSLDDPALLAFALNGLFMQAFHRAGLAPRRDEIGAELIALSARHGLVTYEVLGHLIRIQARSALADFATADQHAEAADRLAERHELPLVGVFTQWYRALRLAATGKGPYAEAELAYRKAAARLEGAGMAGLEHGLLPLALLCLRLSRSWPAPTDVMTEVRADVRTEVRTDVRADVTTDVRTDWGPYEPWARPLVLLAEGRRDEAAAALREAPVPPRDLLFEALWCLVGRAAIGVGDRELMERARAELAPAASELAGAGSGLLTIGPVARHLDELDAALRDGR
ncbi:AfsR/SARP family transcriptional regulator [Streptomyces zagrosensis]|uniref:AfsR/SARP family transcriptional regulator n=1 Tax=Streptomyces zagrosensis TaxID=1042984 RepID=UPI00160FE7F2|nr:BTAD domain-containing putative transcriptional regulator [Streptomyces zagrosensis]